MVRFFFLIGAQKHTSLGPIGPQSGGALLNKKQQMQQVQPRVINIQIPPAPWGTSLFLICFEVLSFFLLPLMVPNGAPGP